eukprot:SAG31_NODE_1958_length_6814_cov_3.386597_2_plen_205_part_00
MPRQDVYHDVSKLLKNTPALLKEFAIFLPEAIQCCLNGQLGNVVQDNYDAWIGAICNDCIAFLRSALDTGKQYNRICTATESGTHHMSRVPRTLVTGEQSPSIPICVVFISSRLCPRVTAAAISDSVRGMASSMALATLNVDDQRALVRGIAHSLAVLARSSGFASGCATLFSLHALAGWQATGQKTAVRLSSLAAVPPRKGGG